LFFLNGEGFEEIVIEKDGFAEMKQIFPASASWFELKLVVVLE
jgi:hypothetical protein